MKGNKTDAANYTTEGGGMGPTKVQKQDIGKARAIAMI